MSDLASKLKELDHKLGESGHKIGVSPEQPTVEAVQPNPEVTIPATPDSAPSEPARPVKIAPPPVENTSPTEQAFEQYKQIDDEHPDESPYVITQAQSAKSDQTTTTAKSQHLAEIENIMTQDLDEIYQGLSAEDQAKFKAKGEAAAQEIASLLDRAKFTAKRVLQLIRDWLKILPGVNRFFIEQEAKIKTEELIRYARRRKHKD